MLLACHYLMLPLVYTNTNLTRVASGKRGVLNSEEFCPFTTGSVHKEHRKFSTHRAEAKQEQKLPEAGEAHGGAGCPPAAHGNHTEQISTCSHGEAHVAAVDRL